jgi:hypothetical protein
MTTPIIRSATATAVARTFANAVASGAFANSADALRIQQSALSTPGLLLADVRLTGVAFAAAPVAGSVQLAVIPRDAAGNQGPTPTATGIVPSKIYTFGPLIGAANSSTGWIMSIDSIPLNADSDFWLYNNGTAQQIAAGCVLTITPWSPGG